MTREEFMRYAMQEIDDCVRGNRNRLLGLVERAWAEGKRNAEIENVADIAKEVFARLEDDRK